MMGSSALQRATIEVRSPEAGVALVELAGEHDMYSGDELRQSFEQALACSDHLIVDLSAAEFIDSTIIALLVQTMRSATELDRKFNVVLGTAPAVERILEITGLIPLLGVVSTVEEALAA
jgi:anti-sigma B factor antagonist